MEGELLDCVTYCPIRPEFHVRTQSGDFDLETLYRYYHDNHLKVPTDPFNRQPLDKDLQYRVIDYAEQQQLTVHVMYAAGFSNFKSSFSLPKHTSLGTVVCHMLTEVRYPGSKTLTSMRDVIEHDFILDDGATMRSLYDLDLEKPVPSSDRTSVRVGMLRASYTKMDELVTKLLPYTHPRMYDADANYMAIWHYCNTYKPRRVQPTQVAHVQPTQVVRIRVIYNEVLDKYFDQDGNEIPELNN